jgi:hypothetical protein
MSEKKDWWDKTDIVARAVASILVPIVVGASVWLWNTESSRQSTASSMTRIAVSILTEPVDEGNDRQDPLREWAIEVLKSPDDPPVLGNEAAEVLRSRPLSSISAAMLRAAVGARTEDQEPLLDDQGISINPWESPNVDSIEEQLDQY